LAPTFVAYGLTHAAVDAVCGGLLFATAAPRIGLPAFLAYNAGAFALQPVVGAIVDRLGSGRVTAISGACLTAAAVGVALLPDLAWPALICAALGNAAFHVGGGIICLSALPGRAAAAGMFVAPGAAGLAVGVAIGRAGGPVWPLAALLLVMAAVLAMLPGLAVPAPSPARKRTAGVPGSSAPIFVALLLVLGVIALRSFIGTAVSFPWKSGTAWLVLLTSATVLGKGVGGWVADRLGFLRVGVGALVVSAPLLALGAGHPVAGVLGIALFNVTMPVTLQVMVDQVPGRTGFAFGLTCLALFFGVAPATAGLAVGIGSVAIIALVSGSAVILMLGLRWLQVGSLREFPTLSDPAEGRT
jgi:hypothetical protein